MSTPANPVVGMINDPDFQKLQLGDQKRALAGIDKSFGTLSDADFVRVSQGLRTASSAPFPGGPVPGAPNGLPSMPPVPNPILQQQPTANQNMALAMSGQQAQMSPDDRAQFEAGKIAGIQSGSAIASIPAAISAPLATAGSYALGYGGSELAGYGAKRAGLGPTGQGLARLGGGLIGGVIGGYGGSALQENAGPLASRILRDPETGKITISPTAIAERVVPQRPEILAKQQAAARDELFNQRAQALMERQAQQDKLDADFAARLKEAETNRQKELADIEKLREQHAQSLIDRQAQQDKMDSDFADRLKEAETNRQKELADIEKFKEQHARAIMQRGIQQDELDAALAKQGKAVPISRSPNIAAQKFAAQQAASNPFGNATSSAVPIGNAPLPPAGPAQPPPAFVSKFETPQAPESRIVQPGSKPPSVPVTYQSYPREQLYEMAKKGDINAGLELIRNPKGFKLPPNFKFLIEEAAQKIPWRNYAK